MSGSRRHPEDLTPLVAAPAADGVAELRAHVEGCAACREQVEESRLLAALFQSADIELPASQWHRIEARLLQERKSSWSDRVAAFLGLGPAFGRRRFAYSMALSAMLVAAVSASSVYYQKHLENKQILMEIAGLHPGVSENPFDAYLGQAARGNPFESRFMGSSSNPFTGQKTVP